MSNDPRPAIVAALRERGITSDRAVGNVLASLEAESNFKPRSESLAYNPRRAAQVFPRYFANEAEAAAVLAQGEEAFGNRVYGGRMGNSPTEGYMYRGRGLIQLTGKDNYRAAGDYLGIDLVGDPDLANDPETAARIAVWYLLDNRRMDQSALEDMGALNRAIGFVPKPAEITRRARLAEDYYGRLRRGEITAPAAITATAVRQEVADESSNFFGAILRLLLRLLARR